MMTDCCIGRTAKAVVTSGHLAWHNERGTKAPKQFSLRFLDARVHPGSGRELLCDQPAELTVLHQRSDWISRKIRLGPGSNRWKRSAVTLEKTEVEGGHCG